MILLRIVAFAIGVTLTFLTVRSIIRTFVLPRSAADWLTRKIFRTSRKIFDLALKIRGGDTYEVIDGTMAYYAPVTLLTVPIVYLALIDIGFTLIFWAAGVEDWWEAFSLSGSSLVTLGFVPAQTIPQRMIAVTEAGLALIMVAVLVAYLPNMYTSFQRREATVSLLEVRAGNPPWCVTMIVRYSRIRGLEQLDTEWPGFEVWFTEIEESHTSLAALVFFRSPKPTRSWVTTAGTILDCAALRASTLDMPREPTAELCIRAGFLALRSIADFFRIPYDANPSPTDPISISREEFDDAYEQLVEAGVPVKPDRDQCWRDFAGWRVNYDTVLLTLANLTIAPIAPWTSDRGPIKEAQWFTAPKPDDTL